MFKVRRCSNTPNRPHDFKVNTPPPKLDGPSKVTILKSRVIFQPPFFSEMARHPNL